MTKVFASKPTHFIEQYGPKFGTQKKGEITSMRPKPIAMLRSFIEETAKYKNIHTISIFKITIKTT